MIEMFGIFPMEHTRELLIAAISEKDLPRVAKLLDDGADINAQGGSGESVLSEAIFLLQSDPDRYAVTKLLLDRGADPGLLDQERGGPLQYAMLGMDTAMLELLLDSGADPNAESGFDDGETLYDWAEFDYRFSIYDLRLPEQPTASDKLSEDSWLAFLQRLADKYHQPPPDHLWLLRRRGARCAHELKGNV